MEKKNRQFLEFRAHLPHLGFARIFDVGANVGQSSQAFREAAPDALIFAFEPVKATFELLRAGLPGDTKFRCFNWALGDSAMRTNMYVRETRPTNRIVTDDPALTMQRPTQEVEVRTGDEVCMQEQIDRINFLKIDTEGFDLKVCKGFEGMLRAQRIDLLQVEAGMHPGNRLHVPIEAFKAYLEPYGYSIFRIYNQVFEANRPQLRRSNVVFLSEEQVRRHTVARR